MASPVKKLAGYEGQGAYGALHIERLVFTVILSGGSCGVISILGEIDIDVEASKARFIYMLSEKNIESCVLFAAVNAISK